MLFSFCIAGNFENITGILDIASLKIILHCSIYGWAPVRRRRFENHSEEEELHAIFDLQRHYR
jgi:hypothetical protein